MSVCRWSGPLLVAGAVACGGSGPPAQSPGTEVPIAQGSGRAESGAPAAGGQAPPSSTPDAASSPEVLAGIKAFDVGNYSEAKRSFEVAVKKNSGDSQAFYNLGMTLEKLGDKAGAEAAYKSALAAKPEFDLAAEALGTLELDAGRTDEALALTRASLARHPGSAPLHENLGVALAMRGDHDAAAAELAQAVKLAPTEPMFHLTFAHWLNAWHVRGATPHLDAALVMAKGDLGMLASIGFEYRMAGEFASCIKTFDRAVQIKDGGEVRTERGICKLGQKDDAGALDDLTAAVTTEPSYPAGHYWLAGRLALLKRYKEAAVEYAKYLQLQPDGSLAKVAAERMKAAQDLAARDKGANGSKKK